VAGDAKPRFEDGHQRYLLGRYAIYVDETDTVWLSDFGANAILSFDPEGEGFTAYPSDRAGAQVRQILGRPGKTWAPESGTDRLVVIRTTSE
jgi:virginiamycin B lyase